MKASVFEAYLEDGEELLWEGFYSRHHANPFDFGESVGKKTSADGRRLIFAAVLFVVIFYFADREFTLVDRIPPIESHYTVLFAYLVIWLGVALLGRLSIERQVKETDRYMSGTASSGLAFAVTSNRLLMYDFSSKQLSRTQSITPELTVIESGRGLTIDSPGAKKWVWPLGDASAPRAVKVIREARDWMKENAA